MISMLHHNFVYDSLGLTGLPKGKHINKIVQNNEEGLHGTSGNYERFLNLVSKVRMQVKCCLPQQTTLERFWIGEATM